MPCGARDCAADRVAWDVFVLCADPSRPEEGAMFHPAASASGWFTDPDTLAVEPAGRQ